MVFTRSESRFGSTHPRRIARKPIPFRTVSVLILSGESVRSTKGDVGD